MRAAVEHVGREDRHQHGVGHADQAHEREQQDDGADRREPERVAESFGDLLARTRQPARGRGAGRSIRIISSATMTAT